MHGGAGGIMSVGLLRAVSFDFMEMCVKSLYSTGLPFPLSPILPAEAATRLTLQSTALALNNQSQGNIKD